MRRFEPPGVGEVAESPVSCGRRGVPVAEPVRLLIWRGDQPLALELMMALRAERVLVSCNRSLLADCGDVTLGTSGDAIVADGEEVVEFQVGT